MSKVYYRFETVSAMVERITGLKVTNNGEIYGVWLAPSLRGWLGSGAQRFHPYEFPPLVVVPAQPSPPETWDWVDDEFWPPSATF